MQYFTHIGRVICLFPLSCAFNVNDMQFISHTSRMICPVFPIYAFSLNEYATYCANKSHYLPIAPLTLRHMQFIVHTRETICRNFLFTPSASTICNFWYGRVK